VAGLGDLFGKGSAAEQLFVWDVLGQVIGALIGPAVTELAYLVNSTTPVVQLSPAELAEAVVRNFIAQSDASDSARKAGLENDKFGIMVDLAGDSLGPDQLATALRRQVIPESGVGPDAVTFQQGVAESNVRDKWAPVIQALALEWPGAVAALTAKLRGQLSDADARALYEKLGGDPQFFDVLFNIEGESPSPLQALDMYHRGIIPLQGTGPDATTYQQAFLESAQRNKWSDAYVGLSAYLPPPRTVVAMLKEGAIDEQTATTLLSKQGLTPELVASYVQGATKPKTETQKEVALSDVLALYEDHILSEPDATAMLGSLGYDAAEAALILKLQDVHRSVSAINTAISRIHSLYVGHKISADVAQATIVSLGVPADQAQQIIATWELEAAVNIRVLTEAQIADAWEYGIMTQDEAMTELGHLGFQPFDAWVVLSIKNKNPLPNPPPPDPANILGIT
jgi:hypothetical protein